MDGERTYGRERLTGRLLAVPRARGDGSKRRLQKVGWCFGEEKSERGHKEAKLGLGPWDRVPPMWISG